MKARQTKQPTRERSDRASRHPGRRPSAATPSRPTRQAPCSCDRPTHQLQQVGTALPSAGTASNDPSDDVDQVDDGAEPLSWRHPFSREAPFKEIYLFGSAQEPPLLTLTLSRCTLPHGPSLSPRRILSRRPTRECVPSRLAFHPGLTLPTRLAQVRAPLNRHGLTVAL